MLIILTIITNFCWEFVYLKLAGPTYSLRLFKSYDLNVMMNEIQSHIKELIIQELTNFPNSSGLSQSRKLSLESEATVSKNLSKSVKYFVENSLSSEIDSHIDKIVDTGKETWQIDAHNLSKVFLGQPKVSCVQESLSNILDSCLKEVDNPSLKGLSQTELEFSPLLQPEHIVEFAECMSSEKPLDVRLNALKVLLKTHFTEAVNGDCWVSLQKKLVENLCDSNIDIFVTCLKAHVKLAACSSSLAIKECALNLIDSLGRHYFLQHNEKLLSLQNISFYRMVLITRLLLDTLREATLNVARFGESKLNEMIDNFVQLMSVHAPSKQSRTKSVLSPLEVVSHLDPNGKWLLNLTHFTLTRQLFFSSLLKNINFLKIIVEEILSWLTEPSISSRYTSKVLQGELNITVQKYSMFCHSLAVFGNICSYDISSKLFPVSINRKDESICVEDVLKILITSLNDSRFCEILNTKCTEGFKTFIAQYVAKMLCFKRLNGSTLLMMLLRTSDSQKPLKDPIKLKIMDMISDYKYLNNPFLTNDLALKKKAPIFSLCFISPTSCSNNASQSTGITKQRYEIDLTDIFNLPIDNDGKENIPFEVFLKYICKEEIAGLKNNPCLIQIMTRVFKEFDRVLGINLALRAQTVHLVARTYKELQDRIHSPDSNVINIDVSLSESCVEFLLNSAATSLGFYFLQEFGIIGSLYIDKLQSPLINWNDPTLLLFATKAATTNEGCTALATESNSIFRKELMKLWSIIEEDCSGSELPIADEIKHLLKVVSNICSSLGAAKALLYESEHGSDVTLTDDTDTRPMKLYFLIQHFGLDISNCPDFIYHQFSLNVLNIMISNLDISLYLQVKLNYQEPLLQMQSDNRIDENSEVIVDECSILRQRIIEQSYLPCPTRTEIKPSHLPPKLDSFSTQAKPRSRGIGELARWLSETRLGVHDQSWLKHARKLYRNTCLDDIKGSTIFDLLEQVVKVFPDSRTPLKWQDAVPEDVLLPEEQLGVQLVMRYGSYHRLIVSTQQNIDNLTHLITVVKRSLNLSLDSFEGFDWFVASVYLLCSGNIDKAQIFLTLVSTLPTGPLMWQQLAQPSTLAQLGNVLETIIAEEMPILFQVLQGSGLSWWQLCRSWTMQCWWTILDWPQICHWFAISILHHLDHMIYFCIVLLHINHDRFIALAQQKTLYEIITNPIEKFQIADARTVIEKMHKKYHNLLHSHLSSI